MRAIKFRGKSIDTDDWIYGHYTVVEQCQLGVKSIHHMIGYDYDYNEVDPETIGQYTGLVDSEGVEVYEGDTIHCVSGYCGDTWIEEFNGKICFNEGEFIIDPSYHDLWSAIRNYNGTIIANNQGRKE